MARIDQSDNWQDRHAPTISTFESLAMEAYSHLPEEFRALTTNLTIEIEDFPDDDVFEDMALETPFDLPACSRAAGFPNASRWRRANFPTASAFTGGLSSITGQRTTKRWAISSPMC